MNIAIFSNDEKTAFKISSDKELDTKYFDFYLVLKLKNGNELKRRYFGILPDQRKSKAVYNERTPKEESFAVMDLGSCSELSNPGERLKCFDKTMVKKQMTKTMSFLKLLKCLKKRWKVDILEEKVKS